MILSLTSGAQWAIFNELSFVDLARFSSISKEAKLISAEYFQHRLSCMTLSNWDHKMYQGFLTEMTPRDAYVAILMATDGIEQDPSVSTYMSKCESFLILGLEYFIGFAKVAARAINQAVTNPDAISSSKLCLEYLLRLSPSTTELRKITSTLYSVKKNHGLILLPEVDLSWIDSYYPRVIDGKYYPSTKYDCSNYTRGLMNEPYTENGMAITNENPHVIYVYGLIDGGHCESLIATYRTVKSKISKVDVLSIFQYMVGTGTVEMIREIITIPELMGMVNSTPELIHHFDLLIKAGIATDNLATVDEMCDMYNRCCLPPQDGRYRPRSNEMVELLDAHGIVVFQIDIFLGALEGGDIGYSLGLMNKSMIQTDIDTINGSLLIAPFYLVQKFLVKHGYDHDLCESLMIQLLINRCAYGVEMLLRMGHVVILTHETRGRFLGLLNALPTKPDDQARFPGIFSVIRSIVTGVTS